MIPPSHLVGTAAVTENLLKRRWSAVILRYLAAGIGDPAEIRKREPELSLNVIMERLRALLRYGLIVRYPRASPSTVVEYRLAPRGKNILQMLNFIDEFDQLPLTSANMIEDYFLGRISAPQNAAASNDQPPATARRTIESKPAKPKKTSTHRTNQTSP